MVWQSVRMKGPAFNTLRHGRKFMLLQPKDYTNSWILFIIFHYTRSVHIHTDPTEVESKHAHHFALNV